MKPLLALLFALYAIIVSAVPAKRERCTLVLADGTKVVATAMGDEVVHFYMTDDGKYMQTSDDGTAYFVEPEALHKRWQAKVAKRQSVRDRKRTARPQKSQGTMTGSKRGLVILVQFTDVAFRYENADFQRLFNEEGYTDDINYGSVHDYFLDQSYGQFDFSFDVVGPITMNNPLSYYGKNNENGDDSYPATMVIEAVQKVDSDVDFSQYDWDGDGVVEQIFLVHSGYDEAQNTRYKHYIWSHAWTLTEALEEGDGDGPVTVDGVVVDSYATSAELGGTTGTTTLSGIGTACHEFSHCFGLPDFYDTVGSSFGMDTWSLMDYGCYNGDGGFPVGFTSYERMFCGWLQPEELTTSATITDMPALTSEPVAYIVRNSGKSDEYYLLENRQHESWDTDMRGHGMLILHVDYDETAWTENTVNTERKHQRMTIVPADNTLYSFSMAGDPWPGTSGNTELFDNSTPSWGLYNENAEGKKLMNHAITKIAESEDGLISFVFDDEALGIGPNGKWEMGDGKWTIENAQCSMFNGPYNLSGLRLSKPTRGLFIQNGKKLLIR